MKEKQPINAMSASEKAELKQRKAAFKRDQKNKELSKKKVAEVKT